MVPLRPLTRLRIRAAPTRFFVPPYVGPSGWVGVWLDAVADWGEVADLLRDSYVLVAPRKVRALLLDDAGRPEVT